MDVESAATCVAYLTSMTSGWNDDATEQLVYEFERLDDADALADAIAKVARTWTSQGRVPLGVIVDAYEQERRRSVERDERAARQMAAVRCDGSGWITRSDEGGTFEWPCSTCSPALVRVWADPELRDRWRNGERLHRILGFDDRAELEREHHREPCSSSFDHEQVVEARDGFRIAARAYELAYDRPPSKAIERMLRFAQRPPREDTNP